MKVPLSWLQEFFSQTLDATDTAERLTLSGIEVDVVQPVGVFDPLIVAAEILELQPLPKAPGTSRLSIHADRRRTLVTTAAELSAGQKIAVALPGATLLASSGLALETVEVTESYGEPSEAVLVHQANLGLGEDTQKAILLPPSVAPGSAVASLVQRPEGSAADLVLHVAILPNIARCQSMLGMAREVAALQRLELVEPQASAAEPAPEHLVPTLTAADACSSLSVTLLDNVQVTESPAWLRRRLVLAGMTPINNVVDASNYVMLELGQPTHPYDADLLPNLELGVRRARAGERLLTLQQAEDEQPAALPEGVPLIVSNDVPVAIAGVLGGRPTAIHAGTRRVLLEAAAFEYVAIRRSQQATKAYSEASARFSRGVNPELTGPAARRFVEILRQSSPALTLQAWGEASLGVPPPRRIELTLEELNGSLGTSFTLADAAESLRRAGLALEADATGATLVANVGNERADITLPCDLIEEVARLQGYEKIPESMPREIIPERLHEDRTSVREALRDALVRAGQQEILTYSLNGPDLEARIYAGHPDAERARAVAVLNPVSTERSLLRSSLLPALLQTAATNLRHTHVCRLFEIGPAFAASPPPRLLPFENERVVLLVAGKALLPTLHDQTPRTVDFFDLKAVLMEVLSCLRLAEGVELVPCDEPPYRPGAAARIVRGATSYGTFGAVHPLVMDAFDLAQPTFVADLDAAALLADAPPRPTFREYDRLPSIDLDIALVVALPVTAGRIRSVVRAVAGPFLRDVEAFDEFRGAQFGERKAIAIRLRLNAGERTLEMNEALAIRARVAEALVAELGAQIRE